MSKKQTNEHNSMTPAQSLQFALDKVTGYLSEHDRISVLAKSGRYLRDGGNAEALSQAVHAAVEQSLANFDEGLTRTVKAIEEGPTRTHTRVELPSLATIE